MPSCHLPSTAGVCDDQLPRHLYRTSCHHHCPCPDEAQNNPCRYARVPKEVPGAAVVCDYSSKQYYHQPLQVKGQILALRDLERRMGRYN